MTIIGFTGARQGLTDAQDAVLDQWANCGEFGGENHHGDCVGADATFHYFAWRYSGTVVVHPPTDPTYRAFVHERPTDGDAVLWEDRFVLLPEKPYLERDRDIVHACRKLIACPASPMIPVGRWLVRGSGTFYTMRYALVARKPITVIWNDGQIEEVRP